MTNVDSIEKGVGSYVGNVGLGKDTTKYWRLRYGNLSMNSTIKRKERNYMGLKLWF